ncbi:MAG: type II secretion system protein J [Candidatus Binatia bacterium]
MKHNKRRTAGFTLVEMVVATALFAAGSVYVYATFTGVTRSTRTATLEIDLGVQNKRALSRMFNEMQATSLTPQDTDGLDSTEPISVFVIEQDTAAPLPKTQALLVNRGAAGAVATSVDGTKAIGDSRTQARELAITRSKRIRFRKVVGYQFSAGAGTILPEWSGWITYSINGRNQLVRQREGGRPRVISGRIDALEAQARTDGTVIVTLISARRNPVGAGWRRYANSVTINPKN